jgi:hypothetical protein
MRWGDVEWDHLGFSELACSEGIDGIRSPELAEAMDIQRVLQVTTDNGF